MKTVLLTQYEVSHRENCALTDGYTCSEVEEDDFVRKTNKRVLVPGNYLTAWQICYGDFQTIEDISEEQKRLQHYRIGFTEDNENYIVLFSGLMLPKMVNGKPEGLILGTVGRTTKYWVDKESFTISKRLFYK
uniref:Uncharacterized protein n=1 Tax=Candidatus Kentrum sp. UNK TaxID=2126344 RepID=A0A451AEM2_9GAMM|nr:MAG: hypothetical protein BECKUNK1418G_GA0071005_10471 [Candidatus Kentron sp. UNK]VFK71102.1 MAG: hypothetical protein BECKUNK1418H_GA0071006_10511 [Candidatus Kentron sp. UNK]